MMFFFEYTVHGAFLSHFDAIDWILMRSVLVSRLRQAVQST